MKTYTVKVWQSYYDIVDIQAESAEQAERIAAEMWERGEIDPEYGEDGGIDIIAEYYERGAK